MAQSKTCVLHNPKNGQPAGILPVSDDGARQSGGVQGRGAEPAGAGWAGAAAYLHLRHPLARQALQGGQLQQVVHLGPADALRHVLAPLASHARLQPATPSTAAC